MCDFESPYAGAVSFDEMSRSILWLPLQVAKFDAGEAFGAFSRARSAHTLTLLRHGSACALVLALGCAERLAEVLRAFVGQRR